MNMHFHTLIRFKSFLTSLVLVFSSTFLVAQNTDLRGVVIDSSSVPMVSATVVLIEPLDSTMIAYALTNEKGQFTLTNIPAGTYGLQITYIGYGTFRQKVVVSGSVSEQDLGIIFLSPGNKMLEEVVVKAEHVPIAVNNDTLEYNAAAFATQPNAPVEDLLKRLPGVTVNRDGSIKAQGEDVENVLVDGKSFFGDDPTLATKNLPADIVDKVQVFDKASDLAAFSGVDDGNDEKTINLALKEDKKNGFFGTVDAGVGQDDPANKFDETRFRGKGNLHRFDQKLQMSALAMTNNNNDRGFSFNDYINFMGGMGNFLRGGPGLTFDQSTIGIPVGPSSTPGITETYAGGVNFNYSPGSKLDWQSSYFINHINNNIIGINSSQNLGDEQAFLRRDTSDRDNLNLNHRLNSTLKFELDSSFQLTWRNRLSYNSGKIRATSRSSSFEFDRTTENRTNSFYEDDGGQFSWTSDLSLRKRLNKHGRLLAANFEYSNRTDQLNAVVRNNLDLLNNGEVQESQVLIQDQERDQEAYSYGLGVTYTEPVGKGTYLNLSVSRTNDNEESERQYYDIDPGDPSGRILNDQLSNHYNTDFIYDQIGTGLRYVRKYFNLSVGVDYQMAHLSRNNISESTDFTGRFENILPRLRLNWELRSNRSLDLRYFTRINAPGIEQLQPVLNNSDPVYIFRGNPNLRPEYIHLLDMSYMLFDEFSFTNLFVNLRGRYTDDRIVNQSSLDSTFRQVVMPVNTDYNYGGNLYINFETPLRFMKSKVSLDASLDFERGLFIVNDLENTSDRWAKNLTLTLENRKKETLDVAVGASLGANRVSYSESSNFDQRYFDQRYFTDISIDLPGNWILSSTVDYARYSNEAFGAADQLFLWSIEISKSFLENERATLKLRAFDILNQNQGINRTNSLNYVRESRSNVLGRYVMLSFSYKLSRFGGDAFVH
ncbi:MAG: outer membrane beta-barrel family protein [Saprospiraceae bacterium]|nr:outer membrane beta-barrel family protein [Saprospiraceae bacterium]